MFWLRIASVTTPPDNEQSCWIARGVTDRVGYVRLSRRVAGVPHPRQVSTHRYIVEVLCGAAAEEVDHRCCNPACWNPDHLEPVTKRVNIARRDGAPRGVSRWPNPVPDALQIAADRAWGAHGRVVKRCPF